MSKTSKIITGILSLMPLLLLIGYFVLFFGFFFKMFMDTANGGGKLENPEVYITQFIGIFAVLFLMAILNLALLIYFIVHITKNQKLDSNERVIWILIIIFVGMIGKPVYWYLKIWQEEESVL